MTTLFPQIKRVDEDETSKIIKNVLFDDQDDVKLQQIFDEFMHLTEESITFSDGDVDDDDDDDDDDVDDIDNDDDHEVADEEEDEEDDSDADEDDDDDDDDEDDDDDDSDSDSDSDDSDSSESEDEKKPEPQASNDQLSASREPLSWNLDQFITIPVTTTKTNTTTTTTTTLTTTPTPSPKQPVTVPVQPVIVPVQPVIVPVQPVTVPPPAPINNTTAPIVKAEVIVERKLERKSEPTPPPVTSPPEVSISAPSSQTQPSGASYIVQIDLSKLRRIPVTKVPTPTTCSNSMMTAKALKHEADAEKDKTKQSIKYLESAMYFVMHGYELETSSIASKSNSHVAFYQDTIHLFKHAVRLSMPGSENQDNMTNLKIHILGLRCLSLLHMKLYKVRDRELYENYKIINSQQNNSPIQQGDGTFIGIRPQLYHAYKKQIQIFNFLKYANDHWQQADQFCDQHPAVRIFFSTIESNCGGSLTMTSPFSKLMDHVKCGLKLLRS